MKNWRHQKVLLKLTNLSWNWTLRCATICNIMVKATGKSSITRFFDSWLFLEMKNSSHEEKHSTCFDASSPWHELPNNFINHELTCLKQRKTSSWLLVEFHTSKRFFLFLSLVHSTYVNCTVLYFGHFKFTLTKGDLNSERFHFFRISTLASKKGQINQINAHLYTY